MERLESFGSNYTQGTTFFTWKPPSGAEAKLNVDDNSFCNSGLIGLIYELNGNWLLGFSCGCDIITNMNEKLQAIFHNLEMTWGHGYQHVWMWIILSIGIEIN